jgi:hypothetical protein
MTRKETYKMNVDMRRPSSNEAAGLGVQNKPL